MNRTYASLLMLVLLSSSLRADDWPQWQGPGRNTLSNEKGLLQQWPEAGPPLAWRIEGLGGGDSAPAVADGKLFGMKQFLRKYAAKHRICIDVETDTPKPIRFVQVRGPMARSLQVTELTCLAATCTPIALCGRCAAADISGWESIQLFCSAFCSGVNRLRA